MSVLRRAGRILSRSYVRCVDQGEFCPAENLNARRSRQACCLRSSCVAGAGGGARGRGDARPAGLRQRRRWVAARLVGGAWSAGIVAAVPVVMVARLEGGARPAGPGRASRRRAERSSRRGRRAGGQASRRTEVWRGALRGGLAGCAERSSRRGRRAGGQASRRTEVWWGGSRGGLAAGGRAGGQASRRTEIWRGARSCSRDRLLRGPVLLSSHPQLVLL